MKREEREYAQMYYEMARAVEKAVRILIEAQQKCEEIYISANEKAPGDQ